MPCSEMLIFFFGGWGGETRLCCGEEVADECQQTSVILAYLDAYPAMVGSHARANVRGTRQERARTARSTSAHVYARIDKASCGGKRKHLHCRRHYD